jgi:flagellar motor switch/type III secretory pathway protein FliN
MSHALDLRVLDPNLCAMNNARLAAGWRDEISVSRMTKGVRYVALESTMSGVPCMAWLPLQRVVDYWMDNVSIPADQLDGDLALAFVRDAFEEKPLPPVLSILDWRGPREIVDGTLDRQPRYRMIGASVELLLDLLPERGAPSTNHLPDIAVPVVFRFGPVSMTVGEIADMETGDVVLLRNTSGEVLANAHLLFNFHTDGDHIVIDSSDPTQAVNPSHLHALSEPDLTLSKLPVEVSFVLANKSMTLSEISTLSVGTTISLESDKPMVHLMAGGYPIALGELVRIGHILGVELAHVHGATQDAHDGAQE